MYPGFLEDLKDGKCFSKIGTARLLDIKVILDNNIVYDGPVDKASSDIKDLYYYKTDVQNNKFIFFVDSEMSNMIKTERELCEENKKTVGNDITVHIDSQITLGLGNAPKNMDDDKSRITKEDFLVQTVDKDYKKVKYSNKDIHDMTELEIDRDIRLLFNQESNRYDMARGHSAMHEEYDDYRRNNPYDQFYDE